MAFGIEITNTFDVFAASPLDKQRRNFNSLADLLAMPTSWRFPYMDCYVVLGADKGKYVLKGAVNVLYYHNDNWVKEDFVDKEAGKQLSDENFTSAEKAKLASLNVLYKGSFTTLLALTTAYPVGEAGWEAIVDEAGSIAQKYLWDASDDVWVLGSGSAASTFAELGGSPMENAALSDAFNTKVDKVAGKGLSTNDFDVTAKGKVDNLPSDTNAALLTKANDNNVMHLTGNEAVAGNKTFDGELSFRYARGADITGSRSLVAGDMNKIFYVTAAAVITIPDNILIANAQIKFVRDTAGEVEFVAGGTTVLNTSGGNLRKRIAEQNSAVELIAKSVTSVHIFGALKI